ncbi:uncharacterized protein LOC132716585 [Ruditapes philippinarum]|uniref:uncharacterized protein LOC132716585 n=1 Tax=Ruditapes philippinarum TaxID=129788 RepID=UPI00295C14A1|nr:uncharacterized protein LOC132716585 [Ruditapes philippinarum]
MPSSEPCLKIGMSLALLTIPAAIVALVLPWWAFREDDFFGESWKLNIGLWKWCQKTVDIDGDSSTACRRHTSPEGYIVTSRCLLIFALLLHALGLVAVVVQRWFVQELILLTVFGPLLLCFAGLLGWVATVTYADKYVDTPGNQPRDIHAGWVISLTTSGFCFISGLLFAGRQIYEK